MNGQCQTSAQWFDTSTQQQTVSTPVLSGAVLTTRSLDLHLSLFRSAVEVNNDALAICACAAESPVIIYANPAFCALTGYEVIDLYGQRYDFMVAADAPQSQRTLLYEALTAKRSATATVRCMQRDGTELTVALRMSPLQNAAGRTTHYLVALREIDEAQHRIEQLKFLAHYDALTGLPNRRLLLDRLDCALMRYERYGEGFTVGFVDVDRFKEINDAFGHAAGDLLLKHVARCLTLSVRASDTVGRLGGDEFLLLLGGASTTAEVHDSLARVLAALGQPFTVAGRTTDVRCSIGVAICPRDGTKAPDLLQRADAAMYRVKRQWGEAPQPSIFQRGSAERA